MSFVVYIFKSRKKDNSMEHDLNFWMQRNRGQFTSSKSKTEDSTGGATTSDANQNWGSPENKIPAASALISYFWIFQKCEILGGDVF